MDTQNRLQEFSVIGGPLHRLGRRLGLVADETDTLRLGLVLGFSAWTVMLLLALLQGYAGQFFSLRVISVHVRLLAAIPLMFYCESIVAVRMAEFVRNVVTSRMMQETDLPAFDALIRRIARLKDTPLAELSFVAIILLLPLLHPIISFPGSTSNFNVTGPAPGAIFWAQAWYFGLCLNLFRFLLLRWVWHLLLWWYFLWRVNKFKLELVPTHPDTAGGLGYLEVVQENFMPLVLAISLVFAASYGEDIIAQKLPFESVYMLIPGMLALNVILFICPLFIFSHKLWKCRARGLDEYMSMAARYVSAFDQKWLRTGTISGKDQLGAQDLQSLADLGTSVSVVSQMRVLPAGKRLGIELTVVSIAPLLPLFLLKYRFDEIILRLLKQLAG